MKADEFFGLLADPTRLEILNLLDRHVEMLSGDLAAALDKRAPNISQHLGFLRLNGIVKNRKEAQRVYYSLTHPEWMAPLHRLINVVEKED